MNALERHIKEINRLYEMVRNSDSKNQKDVYRRKIKELEDDLLEYCSWQNIDFKKICRKIVK